MAWRRRPRIRQDGAATTDHSREEGREQVWEESHAQWDRPEAERVAQWLRSKGAWTGQFDPDGWGEAVPGPYAARLAGSEHPSGPTNGERSLDGEETPGDGGAGLVPSSRVAEMDMSAAHGTGRDVIDIEAAGLLDTYVSDPRAEVAALEQESARLRSEVARLESRVRELTERSEEAGRAAERSRLAELEARADLEAAEAAAKRREEERFDTWAALDAEVAGLERRREELRGSE